MVKVFVNAQPVVAAMNRLMRDIDKPTPALKLTGIMAQGFVQRNIRSAKDSRGEAWPELAMATILRRRNTRKGSIRPLIDTGRLLNSISYKVSWNASEVRVGTNVIYSAAQNFGYPPRNLPAREYMYITQADANRIAARITAWVNQRISAAGFK